MLSPPSAGLSPWLALPAELWILGDESPGCVCGRPLQASLIDIPGTALPARPGSQLQCCSLERGPALQAASPDTQIPGQNPGL